jgi:hypothetical protein
MWQCVKCREEVEENFDACWNCGTSRDGTEDPYFRKTEDVAPKAFHEQPTATTATGREVATNPIMCLRCNSELDHVGTKAFHEGTRWGVLGDLAELFINKERFDVYCCPRCGRVEFFVDGIGEEFRPD